MRKTKSMSVDPLQNLLMRLARSAAEDPDDQVELLATIDEAMDRKQDLSIANAMLALMEGGEREAHSVLWLSTQEMVSTIAIDETAAASSMDATDAEHYFVPCVVPRRAVDPLRQSVRTSLAVRNNLAGAIGQHGLVKPSVMVRMSRDLHDADLLERTSFSRMRQMLRNIVANQPENAQQTIQESPGADADEPVLIFISFAILYSGGGGLLSSGKIGYARTGDAASHACANDYAADMSDKLRNIIAAKGVNDVELTVGLPQWPYAAIYNGISLANAVASESTINHLAQAGQSARVARLEPVLREPDNVRVTIKDAAGKNRSFVWLGQHDLESSINEAVQRLTALGVLCVDASAMHQIAPMPSMVCH